MNFRMRNYFDFQLLYFRGADFLCATVWTFLQTYTNSVIDRNECADIWWNDVSLYSDIATNKTNSSNWKWTTFVYLDIACLKVSFFEWMNNTFSILRMRKNLNPFWLIDTYSVVFKRILNIKYDMHFWPWNIIYFFRYLECDQTVIILLKLLIFSSHRLIHESFASLFGVRLFLLSIFCMAIFDWDRLRLLSVHLHALNDLKEQKSND